MSKGQLDTEGLSSGRALKTESPLGLVQQCRATRPIPRPSVYTK